MTMTTPTASLALSPLERAQVEADVRRFAARAGDPDALVTLVRDMVTSERTQAAAVERVALVAVLTFAECMTPLDPDEGTAHVTIPEGEHP